MEGIFSGKRCGKTTRYRCYSCQPARCFGAELETTSLFWQERREANQATADDLEMTQMETCAGKRMPISKNHNDDCQRTFTNRHALSQERVVEPQAFPKSHKQKAIQKYRIRRGPKRGTWRRNFFAATETKDSAISWSCWQIFTLQSQMT